MRVAKTIRLAVCLLLLSASAHAIALSVLQAQARVLALDSGTTRQRFTDAQVLAFINEGQKLAVLQVKPILKSASFALVAGTTYYAMPADYLQMVRVTLDYVTLPEKSPEALAAKSGGWEEQSGPPVNYYVDFASRTLVGVYPWPAATGDLGTVRYEYYAQATDLAGPTDEPYGGDTEFAPYHYMLAYFAAARMAAIDGRLDLASLYRQEFSALLESMRQEAKNRPAYKPSAMGGNQ